MVWTYQIIERIHHLKIILTGCKLSTVFLYLKGNREVWVTPWSRSFPCFGELMFYRSCRGGLICVGVAFALMCNRQMQSELGKTRQPHLSPREPRNSFHNSFIREPSPPQKRPGTVFQGLPTQRRAELLPWRQIKLNLWTSKQVFVLGGSKFMTVAVPKKLLALEGRRLTECCLLVGGAEFVLFVPPLLKWCKKEESL